ncbi:LPXTG cell wall anchor domain-containing protein [Paenibacillus segetis]|uniref:Methyltransferase n=1 Tax=Paenibacillus segetis TaxID=1325360 RepID=A0ABQ1YE47_9BACL|nr:LPXTG cell wall anchor domain-containing protein [Paenibacillus segetis]GGH22817.1 hypothetical protein GCM10008013_21490 [Paenibacillus segetis]
MGSFDRKVERNMVKLKKKGKNPVIKATASGKGSSPTFGAKGDGDIFKGRKIILPGALSLIAILYAALGLMGPATGENQTLFWVTIGLYLLLAVVIFLRKPYLRVDKNRLYTSKFNRDKYLDASNVSKIIHNKSKIVIVPKGKESKWVFYRFRNFFDTEAMALRLGEFAHTNHITIEKQ